MLCVYPADCTDFSNNGMGLISPSSAIVKETLNGSYELEIVHPYDTNGKWQRLVDGNIVRAPVPSAMTPQVALSYKAISEGKMIYEVNTKKNPLVLRSTITKKYKKLGKYKKGTKLILLEMTTDEFYEVATPDGKHGFMPSASLKFIRNESSYADATAAVMEPRQLRDQPFRIYRVVPELDKVTAYARHIFYDLMDNMVKTFSPRDTTTGQIVIDRLSAACLSEHDFTFYSDLSTTAKEVTFENLNPVDCLLGDGGIIENYGGEVMRDWYDVFVVDRVGNDTNIEIRQGKNLTGIKYDVDATDVTTRIGDAYDKAVFSVLVARSFANLHLSGLATGGVAIGKFSAATYGNPLFECAFPIVLSGSKTYGPESSMPSNPVEGQLYFVVE